MDSRFSDEERKKLRPLAERFAAAVLSYEADIDMDGAYETVQQGLNSPVAEVHYEMAALFLQ